MRFVEVKTPEQQAILAVHRTRDLIVRQRTQTINMLRAQLAEFGVILPQGVYHVLQFAKDCVGGELAELPTDAEQVIFDLCDQPLLLHKRPIRAQCCRWCLNTRCRTDHSVSNCCYDRQRQAVQQWPRVCGLVGTYASQQIKWWEGTLRPHLEDGRSIHTPIIGPWHDVPYSVHQDGA